MKLGRIQEMVINMAKMGITFKEIASLYGEEGIRRKTYPKTHQAIAILTGLGLIEKVPNVMPWRYKYCGKS